MYWSRGLGGGKYDAVRPILDEKKLRLVHHPRELERYEEAMSRPDADPDESVMDRVASFGSWPALFDADGDGDLDMLVGSFAGKLWLRQNEGTRKSPVWASRATPVEAGREPIDVGGHCAPVVADWDADGLPDLVVGAHDGSVGWFRNVGERGKPRFEARRILVESKSETKFVTYHLEPGDPPQPGARAQICVTDYDGDGRLDLLVGDYAKVIPLRELDAQERRRFDALVAKQDDLLAKIQAARVAETEPSAELLGEYESLGEKKKAFYAGEPRNASYVWFFRRKAPGGS